MPNEWSKDILNLGGKVEYNAKADKIIIKDGKAAGIRLFDGREIYGDAVVSCADGYYTLYHMLEGRYTPEIYRNLFENPKKYPTPTCALVFLGVWMRNQRKIPCDCRETKRARHDWRRYKRNGFAVKLQFRRKHVAKRQNGIGLHV